MSETQQDVANEQPGGRAREVLLDIVTRMGIDAEVEVVEEGERIRLDIRCDDPDRLVGRRGQVLDALQHLVGKIVFRGRSLGEGGAPAKPLVVDADGYRERHAERLRSLAQRMAEKVVLNQRPMAMDPMTPHDRRIMHLALAEDSRVTTHSEGEGEGRHMVIAPVAAE